MQVRHSLTMTARCPVNQAHDVYAVTVETDRLIPVEAVTAAVAVYRTVEAYQEDITVALAQKLGARVTTVGKHGEVETTCTASEPLRG